MKQQRLKRRKSLKKRPRLFHKNKINKKKSSKSQLPRKSNLQNLRQLSKQLNQILKHQSKTNKSSAIKLLKRSQFHKKLIKIKKWKIKKKLNLKRKILKMIKSNARKI